MKSFIVLLLCLLAAPAPASAETLTYQVSLSKGAMVPATSSTCAGRITVTYDTETKIVTWNGVYSGCSSPVLGAHFHLGDSSRAGPVIQQVFDYKTAKSQFTGSVNIVAWQEQKLLAGEWYFDIHTANNIGGAIRGQIK